MQTLSDCMEDEVGGMATTRGTWSFPLAADSGDHLLYRELWHACAGALVTVPHQGDLVFYFPQGHIEQVEASTSQVADAKKMPAFDLPAKILCRVIDVELKAEPDTEEVFALVNLLPLPKQNVNSVDKEAQSPPRRPPRARVQSFCKILTPSDASTHGGLSVLRRHAEECLPPLDMSKRSPTQELVAKDLHGKEWRFRHIYRGQPRRHLLQSGWSLFVGSKRLVAGDTFILIRGETGELLVGVRHAMRQQSEPSSSSVLSCQNMHMGVLATVWHAISTRTKFTVLYKPRISPSEFLVPLNKYAECVKKTYSIGLRFKMRFEAEDAPDKGFTGTVIGIEDVDHQIRWPGSEWRSLKVSWDEPQFHLPHRVSPWEIEPAYASAFDHSSVCRLKRPNAYCMKLCSSTESSNLMMEGVAQEWNGGFQGHEVENPRLQEALIASKFLSLKKRNINGDGNWRLFGFSLPSNNVASEQVLQHADSTHRLQRQADLALQYDIQDSVSDAPLMEKLSPSSFTQHAIQGDQRRKTFPSSSQIPEDFHQGKLQGHSTRSCIKVHKQGVAVGRSVDLTKLNGYDELIAQLDQILEFHGELVAPDRKWRMVFTDDEGDMMLLGDDPWPEFCSFVRRIFIYSREELKNVT